MRSLIAVPVLFLSLACEDEKPPPPPNEPEFVGAPLVQCRPIEGVYKLDRVEFSVRDLDGVEDLREPVVVVEATRLTMTESPRSWDPANGECATEACEATYAWEHTREGPQIYCGEDGTTLKAVIEVTDTEGWTVRGQQKATAL